MSRIGDAHAPAQRPGRVVDLWCRLRAAISSRHTRRSVALAHYRGCDGEVHTREISAWFLDVEIHDGQLRLINAHDEEVWLPAASLLTIEIR